MSITSHCILLSSVGWMSCQYRDSTGVARARHWYSVYPTCLTLNHTCVTCLVKVHAQNGNKTIGLFCPLHFVTCLLFSCLNIKTCFGFHGKYRKVHVETALSSATSTGLTCSYSSSDHIRHYCCPRPTHGWEDQSTNLYFLYLYDTNV